MQNLEYKAELKDPALARSICAAIGAAAAGTLRQTDTYFRHEGGRFKRREVPGEPTEWIVYERADRAGPKLSRFTIYTDSEALERFPAAGLRAWVVVRKTRELLVFRNVRIHLDAVEGLGHFIEFEALVLARHDAAECEAALAELRRALAPAMGEAIAVGYSDLLAGEGETDSDGA